MARPTSGKELILGGARSGKTRLAQQRAADSGREVVYIATAQALDGEMAQRIARHRAERPGQWTLVEEPLALAATLKEQARADRCLLVDCLTLWLSNLLAVDKGTLDRQRQALLDSLPGLPGQVILVSNEVGQGIVPVNPLARRFRDEAGRLHQDLALLCQRVTLVVAGLPLALKETPS
ncbi:MAG: bifunctional adenosylcobinamide kinase/adenosylcobinamide-phosphate guanylyltransferase [Candidatus Competibacteraceae bacterium]|nr:bifunctional adenosylcobinamide kinase/adenosylcobinamide-phosphate guanylyltransferase [Candidatus Competibacteraceae bacterium]